MVLDKETNKVYNQEPDACWECYSCVKICAQQAIEVRGYADFVPMGASIIPLRSTNSIIWTVKFRDGRIKRFKFSTRTTKEGSIVPYDNIEKPSQEKLKTQNLCTGLEKELPKPVKLS